MGGKTYYRKETSLGHYQTLYGEVALSRYLYQSSAGGATLCPLERNCQLSFGAATPLLAEVVSLKLASASAGEVAQDLAKSHGLSLSATYLHHLAQQVGQVGPGQTGDLALSRGRGTRPGGDHRHGGGWHDSAPRRRSL